MAAPEAEVVDFDDGKEAFDSFMSLRHAVADANAAAASPIDQQPAPKASAAPPPAATPPGHAWAVDPATTPQQPDHPPPWWAWRHRQDEAASWEQAAEEVAAEEQAVEEQAWQEWERQGWQQPETYTTAAREPVSSEIFHWNCVRVGITKHPGGPLEVMFKIRPVL